jgi:class 3 adenylate cyclase
LVFQNGGYFGRTVNIGARITDYARSGEVLVSDAVAAATDGFHAARYQPVGPVSLKGLTAPITLYTAVRAD